jgi:transcriptional regulator with XRE-family HTH domain
MRSGIVQKRIRAKVRGLRDRRGWTQAALADLLRPHLPDQKQQWAIQPNISKYEKGDINIDLDVIVAFAAVFRVSMATLIDDAPLPPLTEDQREAQQIAEWWVRLPPEQRTPVRKLLESMLAQQEASAAARGRPLGPREGPAAPPATHQTSGQHRARRR